MSPLPTPKIVDLDDPLLPRAEPTPAAPPTPDDRRKPARSASASRNRSNKPPTAPSSDGAGAPGLAGEPLVAVFARLPESVADRLAQSVRAINADRPRRARVSQQDVLGAVVESHITPDDVTALAELVDAYRQRTRR